AYPASPMFLRDGQLQVGCCGLKPYDLLHGVLEIGFHLRSEFWGKGLAAEGARAAITHAVGPLGAKALFAGHHPDNRASRKVVERLGLRYTDHELYPPTDREHQSYLLRREDYLAGRRFDP